MIDLKCITQVDTVTHMPFAAIATDGTPVLFYCCAKRAEFDAAMSAYKWKLWIINGEARRIPTGFAEDVIECSPSAWCDETGWHVSFIAGGAPSNLRYRLYRMDGPTLDTLNAPVAIQSTRAGFVHRNTCVWSEVESVIHVRNDGGEYTVEIPLAAIYRVSFDPHAPNTLLITAGWLGDQNPFTVEVNLDDQSSNVLLADGGCAYKPTVHEGVYWFAIKGGDHFEDRRIVEANTITRLPTSMARIKRVDAQSGIVISDDKCGCTVPEHVASDVPTRRSCRECVEKHIGSAYVLLTETREGYAHRLRAVGHLYEAEDESQEWPELHDAVRAARKGFQVDSTMPDWRALEGLIASV